jgi:hypothetical protein
MSFSGEKEHLWKMRDSLLSVSDERAGEGCDAGFWSVYDYASSRLALHHVVDGFRKPPKKAIKKQ